MNKRQLHILLADDDKDDCMLFKEALESLPYSFILTQFHFGDELMYWLYKNTSDLPDALFLDLNMPRKSGFQCLSEIKQDEKLKHLPTFIISTSYEKDIVDQAYNKGAQYYIRKPNDFLQLKKIIAEALVFIINKNFERILREKFILTGNLKKQL